jgi:hypothetical protein
MEGGASARLGKRAAWRFGALYLALYLLPFPFDAPFEPPGAPAWYAKVWDPLVGAVGRALGVHGSLKTLDGPDAPGHYVQVACFALLAAATAIAWTLLDRRRPRDGLAHEALRSCVRYALAAAMLAFGFAKVFTTQMPLPEPSQLLETYGHSSRMGLLWTFMGASPAYERFAGGIEVLGGALLLPRRTTVAGALVCSAATANVVAMNFAYDVPVKVYSTHLLLASLFLLERGARPLVGLLLFGRGAAAIETAPAWPERWRRPTAALHALFVAGVLYTQAGMPWRYYRELADGAPVPALYGIYDVEEMRRAGAIVPPLLTDATCWHRLAFGRRGARVVYADGSRSTLYVSPGGAPDRWLAKREEGGTFTLTRVDDGAVIVDGTLDGEHVTVRARPTDGANVALVQPGFHWVHAHP